MQNKNGTIVSQNGASNPVIRLVRTLDSYANIDYTFDESLVPNGIFREVYDYIKDRTDVPEQFIFTGVLAMFCGIVGNRIFFKGRVWKFKPHDYFILMAGSGYDKTTILEKIRGILEELEEKINDNPYNNVLIYPDFYPRKSMLRRLLDLMCEKSERQSVFLYPESSTLRGLVDLMRGESEAELHARSVAKEKGKPEPPPRVPQRSGVAIFDEVSELFVIRSEFKKVLVYTLIQLWDGSSTSFATSIRTGGVRWFKGTALTVLSASTPIGLIECLSKNSRSMNICFLDLIFSRFQVVNAGRRLKLPKSLGRLILEWQNNGDEIKKRYNEILEKLKQFYQFVCRLSQAKAPVLVSEEAKALDRQSAQAWHEERMDLDATTAGYMTEITGRYMTRLDVRKVRYALLFSILECYDQHGQSADAITMTGTALQKAIEVCELFKKHTLHFLVKAKEIRPRLFSW